MNWSECFAGKEILVVDDDHASQDLMQDILETMNCKTTAARSGEEALEMFQKRTFDLIFMDMRLPGKNGVETIKQMRILEGKNQHVPILALSGSALEDPENMLTMGIDGWIIKPLHLDELRQRMAEILLKGNAGASS